MFLENRVQFLWSGPITAFFFLETSLHDCFMWDFPTFHILHVPTPTLRKFFRTDLGPEKNIHKKIEFTWRSFR